MTLQFALISIGSGVFIGLFAWAWHVVLEAVSRPEDDNSSELDSGVR